MVQKRGHKVESTIRKGKTYDVLSIQREHGNGTATLGKSDISKEILKKKGQGKNTCGSLGACEGPWLQYHILSTCPRHTNSGCGKERRILIGPWCQVSTRLELTTLRFTGPVPARERHRYAVASPDKLGTDPMAYGGFNE